MKDKKTNKKEKSKQRYEPPHLEKINVSKIHRTPMMSSGGPFPYVYIE